MSNIGTLSANQTGFRARVNGAPWIESPVFDLFLMVLAPLSILPIIACAFWLPVLGTAMALVLAFAHYASSYVFYFWDENRNYYRTRWLAFFAGPVGIATICAVLIGFEVPNIFQFLILFWNTWHVARQNCGILSIYRNRAGVKDSTQTQRSAANNAIIAVSIFLMLWNVDTNHEVVAVFSLVSERVTAFAKLGAGVVAAFFICRLVLALLRRKEPIGIPEGLFLATSIAFFYPYLFVRTSVFATAVMLLPHYVQYMALVWLLHRRKFGETGEGAPVILRRMSSKLTILIPILLGVGLVFFAFQEFLNGHGYQKWRESIFLVIILVHFYLDGLIWSFRQPHIRQTILPFLMPARQRAPVS